MNKGAIMATKIQLFTIDDCIGYIIPEAITLDSCKTLCAVFMAVQNYVEADYSNQSLRVAQQRIKAALQLFLVGVKPMPGDTKSEASLKKECTAILSNQLRLTNLTIAQVIGEMWNDYNIKPANLRIKSGGAK